MDIYLAGVLPERLVEEVTCGDIGLEGVKVVVPPMGYVKVMDKLKNIQVSEHTFHNPITQFLRTRCSKDFLERYFEESAAVHDLPHEIKMLYRYDDSLGLLCRLREFQLVPEDVRRKAVERIRILALRDYSLRFVEEPIAVLFTNEELRDARLEICDALFSNVDEVISEARDGWDMENEDPEDPFSRITESLRIIRDSKDEAQSVQASDFLRRVDEVIWEMELEKEDFEGYEAMETEESIPGNRSTGRDIFDDVDQ